MGEKKPEHHAAQEGRRGAAPAVRADGQGRARGAEGPHGVQRAGDRQVHEGQLQGAPDNMPKQLSKCLKRCVENEKLKKVKASYKLGTLKADPKPKKPKKKKVVKKKVVKKKPAKKKA